MLVKQLRKNMVQHFNIIFIVILFIWISFFPPPIQEKYYFATKAFLALSFVVLLIKEGTSIFKLSHFPLWIFLAAIGINVLFAQHRDVAFRTYSNLAIPIFFIYYLVSQGITSELHFNLLTKTICITSIVVSLLAIFEMVFVFNPMYKYFITNPYYERYISGFVRPMSTQFNPAPLGSYLLGALPFNFLLFKKWRSFFKLLGTIGVILNTTVIIFTFARGSLFGFTVLVIFYLFMQRSYRLIVVFLLVLSIFMFVCDYLPYPINKFGVSATIGGGGMLSKYRLARNTMTMDIVKDHPFVGLGFQHFRIRFYEYYPYNETILYEKRICDNMFLTILSETGIIGFLGFLIFVFSIFRQAFKGLTKFNYTSFKGQSLLLSLSAFVSIVASMIGYEFFYWPNQYLHFCLLAGWINAYCSNIAK